jgi:hypothetical protein
VPAPEKLSTNRRVIVVKLHGVGKISFVMCVAGVVIAVLTVGPVNVGLFWGLSSIHEAHWREVVAIAIPAAWIAGAWMLWKTASGRAWLEQQAHKRRGFAFGFLVGAIGPIIVLGAAIYLLLGGQ